MSLFRAGILLFQLSVLFPMGIQAGERFVLGAEDQAGPWGLGDGTGCGNDVVKTAFAASGDSVVLEIYPYGRAKKKAIKGELTGCFAMSWEPGLKDKIIFSEKPLYKVQYILVKRHGSKVQDRSINGLAPKSILGLVKDYEYPLDVRAVANNGVLIEETASEVQNLKKLAAGRIEATVVNCESLKSLSYLLKQAAVEGKIDSISVVGIEGSFVGFSLRNPSGMRAKERFDNGMAIILKNGTYDSILRIWFNKCNPSVKEGVK
jgi:polar amino acid transport system substrate-binding protein